MTQPLATPARTPAEQGPSRAAVLTNLAMTQVAWFACVLSAAAGRPVWGTLTAAVLIAGHLWWARRAWPEFQLVLGALVVGMAFDAVLVATGAVLFPQGPGLPVIGPVWLLALWAAFATSMNVSMRWMRGRLWLAAVLGAVVGPVSFLGGVRLDAAVLPDTPRAIAVLAVGWAIAMPLLVVLSQRFDGVTRRAAALAWPGRAEGLR